MKLGTTKLFLYGLVATLMAASAASAQNVRVRATIDAVDGNTLSVTSREGQKLTIKLADNVNIAAVVPAKLSDIKSGTFVGIASTPMTGGMQRAVEVLIFPEAMRGAGEGHYAWDLMPESSMTNATVVDTVTDAKGPMLTLKYKDGEQKIFVPPEAPVVTFAPGEKAELKPGAKIFISAAAKQPDGTLTAARVGVGRGIDPPM